VTSQRSPSVTPTEALYADLARRVQRVLQLDIERAGPETTPVHRAEHFVAVTDEIARCLIPWECFGDLPGDPLGGWIAVTTATLTPVRYPGSSPSSDARPRGLRASSPPTSRLHGSRARLQVSA
jgi:hypothetical protein